MGLRTLKPHSGLSKNIKFFTLNSILLSKTNYMLLFTSCTKIANKKIKKGEYTGTLLSPLSKADSTRFQHKIFSKPITIVSTVLFVLKFSNLPQGDILTRAEKHFEELKDTSLPLPIWYQDGLTNQWKSGKLILQGKGHAYISPDGSNEVSWLLLQKICPQETTGVEDREEKTKSSERRNSSTSYGGFRDFQKSHSTSSTS